MEQGGQSFQGYHNIFFGKKVGKIIIDKELYEEENQDLMSFVLAKLCFNCVHAVRGVTWCPLQLQFALY